MSNPISAKRPRSWTKAAAAALQERWPHLNCGARKGAAWRSVWRCQRVEGPKPWAAFLVSHPLLDAFCDRCIIYILLLWINYVYDPGPWTFLDPQDGMLPPLPARNLPFACFCICRIGSLLLTMYMLSTCYLHAT